MNKTVFITYSWDTNSHQQWVKDLADKLISNGIDVKLDQYDLAVGQSTSLFMEKSIAETDHTLVILTPEYKAKVDNRHGGSGYEFQMITGSTLGGGAENKFIPILKQGEFQIGPDCAVPHALMGTMAIDFRDTADQVGAFDELVRFIYKEPKHLKPVLGKKPDYLNSTGSTATFKIHLDQDFNITQSDLILSDILFKILEKRKQKQSYQLEFEIEYFSDLFRNYELLCAVEAPSDKEIKEKLSLYQFINSRFYRSQGTLYDYMSSDVEQLIGQSYERQYLFREISELGMAVRACIKLFNEDSTVPKGLTNFDVMNKKQKAIFKVYLTDEEVEKLQSSFGGVKDPMLLTSIGGLTLGDLDHQTIVEKVLPKMVHRYTIDYIEKELDANAKYEYFNTGNWTIGLG